MFVEKAPSVKDLFSQLGDAAVIEAFSGEVDRRAVDGYLHWDKLRRLAPPQGLTSEQWWLQVKTAREADLRSLPLTDPSGVPFHYGLLDSMLRRLHYIDQRCSGEVGMDEVVISEKRAGRRFLVNSLME